MRLFQTSVAVVLVATAPSPTTLADAPLQAVTARIIYVKQSAAPGGNGGAQFPYRDIQEALAKARTISRPVIIDVAPGTYEIEKTLVIDRSLVLRGPTVLTLDSNGIPRGDIVSGRAARIVASAELGEEPLMFVGRSDGVVITKVTIRGFVFKHVNGLATEITVRRVQGYEISGNMFRSARFGVESIASSGTVAGNSFGSLQSGAVLAAGYPASPSRVTFKENRSVHNSLGGVLLVGSSVWIPEKGDQLDAVVQDNILSGNEEFGVRLFIVFRLPGFPGDTQATGNIRAVVHGNKIQDNKTAFLLDAGFPFRFRDEPPVCDPRSNYHGSINLTVFDNSLSSKFADAWVIFTRWPGGANPFFRHLHSTTFGITDPDGVFTNAIIDHPERDPTISECPGDATYERLNNVLRINGQVMPYAIF